MLELRSQFNCLLTATATAQETDRIRKDLKGWQGDPPEHIRKKVLNNVENIWTAKNTVATLRPEEMEEILGYPNFLSTILEVVAFLTMQDINPWATHFRLAFRLLL